MQLSKKANVLILSHFYKRTIAGGGPPQEIRDYFLPNVQTVSYIEHPFPYSDDHRSSMSIYKNGKLEKQIFTPSLRGPQMLFYILDIFLTFYFLLRAKTKFDLCIALDNLNTVSVLPFKKLGIIKKLVFYTIDFTPKRFENKLLNYLYHLSDRIACYNAGVIWVTSKRAIEGRVKNGVSLKKSAPSILLPMGANLSRIKILPINKINRYDIVFVGHLLEKQGVQIVLETLPKVITRIPKLRFIVVGQGEYEQELRTLANKLKIGNHVMFMGFIKDHKVVENILCKSAIGVAPYQPSEETYTFYGDPGKPKLYLGCGLPVVITDVPTSARVIQKKQAGIIIDYNTESLERALLFLFTNGNYEKYRANAIKLSKEYDTEILIQKALDKT